MSIVRFNQADPAPHKHWYYLGAALGLWTTWQASTVAGVLLGAGVPPSWQLDFAVPLMFLALLAKALKDRRTVPAAAVGGAVAVFAVGLPHHLGLIAGALAGVACGGALDLWRAATRRPEAEEAPCSSDRSRSRPPSWPWWAPRARAT